MTANIESTEGMNLYWFTFGLAHPLSKMVQGVLATSEEKAREVMHEFYGNKWAFCYKGKHGDSLDHAIDLGGYLYGPIPKIMKEGDLLQ